MKQQDRVVLDISYKAFSDAILSALEKDTGAVPIIPEILRVLKIKQRKERIAAQRLANLAKATAARHVPKPIVVERKSWWQCVKLRRS